MALFVTAVGAAACASAFPDSEPAPKWVRVLRDPNYEVSIDTVRIARALDVDRMTYGWRTPYEVWYRTDHSVPRLHNDKPFNREVVHSVVQCDSMVFKVMSVDMSMGDEKPISIQRTTNEELVDQPWRRVARGTAEEVAAQAACHFAKRRSAARR